MKINFYIRTCPFQARLDALQHLAAGIKRVNRKAKLNVINDFTFDFADVSVMWGMPKPFQSQGKLSRERCSIVAGSQFTNTPLLVLDMPLFGRTHHPDITHQEDAYRILEGHALGYGSYYIGKKNRWNTIAKRYSIELKDQKQSGIIGIAGQRKVDADMFGDNIADWVDRVIKRLRINTDEPIGIKPHPMDRSSPEVMYSKALTRHKNVELINDISKCKSLITYTSNVAADALVEGIPTISCHPANLCHNYISNDVLDAINPTLDGRAEALNSLSYSQWTLDEMSKGTAWKHIKEIL